MKKKNNGTYPQLGTGSSLEDVEGLTMTMNKEKYLSSVRGVD